jgi:hypothetical protein
VNCLFGRVSLLVVLLRITLIACRLLRRVHYLLPYRSYLVQKPCHAMPCHSFRNVFTSFLNSRTTKPFNKNNRRHRLFAYLTEIVSNFWPNHVLKLIDLTLDCVQLCFEKMVSFCLLDIFWQFFFCSSSAKINEGHFCLQYWNVKKRLLSIATRTRMFPEGFSLSVFSFSF